jgi:hypothetical protein
MERGSTQHGARLDDELAEGVEALVTGAPVSARAREAMDPEAPAADEIDLGAEAEHDAVVERSELARWLLPSSFPGDAAALIAGALAEQAPDAVLAVLRSLDPAKEFLTPGDVWVALGHETETRERADVPVEPDAPAVPVAEPAIVPRRHEPHASTPGPERSRPGTLHRLLRLPVAIAAGAVRGAVDAATRVLLDE